MEYLVFQHVPDEHPGLIANYFQERNIGFDVVRFFEANARIPENVSDYRGLIIMGGPMGVYDNRDKFPSKEDEIAVIRANMGKLPMLGICLGSQLLAHVLGGKVDRNLVGGKHTKEVGIYKVELTNAGISNPIFKGFSSPVEVMEWHGDMFTVPNGATLLASSQLCRNQAFVAKGNMYATLFHFEMTPKMFGELAKIDKDWIPPEINVEEMLKEVIEKEELMRRQSVMLMDNFVGSSR